jgi:hypothetical protein
MAKEPVEEFLREASTFQETLCLRTDNIMLTPGTLSDDSEGALEEAAVGMLCAAGFNVASQLRVGQRTYRQCMRMHRPHYWL